MKIAFLMILFSFSSCSIFGPNKLSNDISKEAKHVCMNSEGKGRLVINNKKYIFSYESLLDSELAKWQLILDFPLRAQESFMLDWSKAGKMSFKSTIDTKILRENSNVNPKEIELFVSQVGHYLKDLINLRSEAKKKLKNKWILGRKSLKAFARNKKSEMLFTNINADSYFGLMAIEYQGNKDQAYKLEFLVRKCFKSQKSHSDII